MISPSNPVSGPRVLPHERLHTYDLGGHTLEVVEDPADPIVRTVRLTAVPSNVLDGPDTVAEDVCLSWEEAYKLLITLHALFHLEQQADA